MPVNALFYPHGSTHLEEQIHYPESDGKPMSDNTKQFEYITTIKGNLDILMETKEAFVAGDLLWYPIEGDNRTRMAPDVMVALGRPKGHRGSYQQWKEGDIPPQVAFEILSSCNRPAEMARKFRFYQEHGVEEYYIYDPDRGTIEGWLRGEWGLLEAIGEMNGWVSPLLGIHFELVDREMWLSFPDGNRFHTFVALNERCKEAEVRAIHEERLRVEAEERIQTEIEARKQAEQQIDIEAKARMDAERSAQAAETRMKEMEARLRRAGLL